MPSNKRSKPNKEDDPFDFEALSSMKQVTPARPAGNRIDVEVTQAASERVLVVSCKKARIKMGVRYPLLTLSMVPSQVTSYPCQRVQN